MRTFLLVSLTVIAVAGLIWGATRDEEPTETADTWNEGPGRSARRPRRDRSARLPNQAEEPGEAETVGLPRGAGDNRVANSTGVEARTPTYAGDTVQLGEPGSTVVVAPPPEDGVRRPDPDAVADLRARQLERIVVSLGRLRAELAEAEESGDEVEIARLSEVERQLLARQSALEEAAAEGR